MASDHQSRLQQLLYDEIERRRSTAAESRRTRVLINETGIAIARALRNELTVVSGNIELIGMKHVSDAVHRFAGNAQLAAESATRVLNRLSLLDQIGTGERISIDVHRQLLSLRSHTENQVRTDIDMKWTLVPCRSYLDADPDEFRMIMLELLENAFEAMPTGGTFTVWNDELRLRTAPEQAPEWWLAIEVCDTGTGMPQEQYSAALAPVTRVNGQVRLALGLCLLDRFIAQHDGILNIRSLQGQGTTVTMLMPHGERSHASGSDT